MNDKEALGRRKEPRFKTADEHSLQCDCFHENEEPKRGHVIDISTHGMRFLSDGNFRTGQVVLVELKTEPSLGAFGGIVRRVNPWVGGQTVFGCELVEPLTDDDLKVLAERGIVDRRNEHRIAWNQPAKMSWELQLGEIDVEILDCSTGGLRVTSCTAIPESVHLRIRLDSIQGKEEAMTARVVWQMENDDQLLVGLAFNHREIPEVVTQVIANSDRRKHQAPQFERLNSIRPSLMVVTAAILLTFVVLQTGLLQ